MKCCYWRGWRVRWMWIDYVTVYCESTFILSPTSVISLSKQIIMRPRLVIESLSTSTGSSLTASFPITATTDLHTGNSYILHFVHLCVLFAHKKVLLQLLNVNVVQLSIAFVSLYYTFTYWLLHMLTIPTNCIGSFGFKILISELNWLFWLFRHTISWSFLGRSEEGRGQKGFKALILIVAFDVLVKKLVLRCVLSFLQINDSRAL